MERFGFIMMSFSVDIFPCSIDFVDIDTFGSPIEVVDEFIENGILFRIQPFAEPVTPQTYVHEDVLELHTHISQNRTDEF